MKYTETQLSMRKLRWQQIGLQELSKSARRAALSERKRIYEMNAANWLSQEAMDSLGIQRAIEAAEGWHWLAALAEIIEDYKLTASNKF